MEKIYTKIGYSITDERGNIRTVTKVTLEKSLVDMQKIKANIEKNIATLTTDLQEIANI